MDVGRKEERKKERKKERKERKKERKNYGRIEGEVIRRAKGEREREKRVR
jgi:hypothetical protein